MGRHQERPGSVRSGAMQHLGGQYVDSLLASEKVDHLLSHQWERLVQIQELQLELLSAIGAKK